MFPLPLFSVCILVPWEKEEPLFLLPHPQLATAVKLLPHHCTAAALLRPSLVVPPSLFILCGAADCTQGLHITELYFSLTIRPFHHRPFPRDPAALCPDRP